VNKYLERLDYGPALESDKPAQDWLMGHGRTFGHFIDGVWCQPNAKTYRSVINPATSEAIAQVGEGDEADVEKAMIAAKKAFPLWSKLHGHERAKYLYAIERALAQNARLFAVLESIDNGKTIRETRDIDIPLAIRHFTYHAGWAEIHEGEYPELVPGGVIGQIIPWNFPLLMLAWKIAPAIAVGNTVVLKPAESTPLTALLFAEMLVKEVKLPRGVVNIVFGGGEVGELIVKHKTPWKIAFTGSTAVGRAIRKSTAGEEKHLTLELGGKSPFIVFADADLDSAVEGVVDAIWFNQGQVCCAGSRLLLEESIAEEFVHRLKVRAEKLRVGPPLDKTMDIGAINSRRQYEKIMRLIDDGVKEGAVVWQPKHWQCPPVGFFVPPLIFTNVAPTCTIAQEEIFGPVLVVMSFRTPKEAVELANNTRYGLAASVWSENIGKANDVAGKIKAGTVWINSTNLFDAAAGFGGFRESGYGREGGREGIFDVLKDRTCDISARVLRRAKIIDATVLKSEDCVDRTRRFLIGGKLVRPDGGMSFPISSPSGVLLGSVGDAGRKDVRNAVEAARGAFESWRGQSAHLRAQILYFFAENLDNERERFADLLRRQTDCEAGDAKSVVKASVERLFYYAALADKFEGTVQPVSPKMTVVGVKEPLGVIGIRPSDLTPLLGIVSAIAPAIVMGNTVVAVTGQYDALSASDLIQVVQTSDVPPGVVNILSAANPDALAKVLAEHEDVDAVWFFGGRSGGAVVEAASASNMKRTWAEEYTPGSGLCLPSAVAKKFLRQATQVKNIWTPFG